MEILKLNRKKKIMILLFIDIISIIFAYGITGFYLSYNKNQNLSYSFIMIFISIAIYIISLWSFKMYKSIWINAGTYEATQCTIACLCAGILNAVLMSIIPHGIPIEVNIASFILILILTVSVRMSLRITRRAIIYGSAARETGGENTLIIGAGLCAVTIINEIRLEKKDEYNIIGIIDDDKDKKNTFLNGVKVIGNRNDIPDIVKEHDIKKILFSIAKIDAKEKKKILDICGTTIAETKVIPGYYELLENGISLNRMRKVDLKDLIGREEVKLDKEDIRKYIENKTVLVTGGGGSIGSELCRQIARFNPKLLLILDIYENNAYDLQNELKYKYPNLNKRVIIASVRDKHRINQIFSAYRPELVFHAAAHKHVPLMEDNPSEAIKNNVMGTLNVAKIASQYKVEKFVLISTDKAVNPTNVMGATKRLCEMIVQAVDNERGNKTDFVAVRFGNVLGSNGSVIPLFKKQIENGGPVTLTHEKITRYFMLIPEAAQLVLQAGAYAKGGEVFVLDMGSPVKIYDLAENLIKLSGYTPHKDIKIEITGLRPGEKLYEELLMNNDSLTKTLHEKIFIDRPETLPLNELTKNIDELMFISQLGNKNMLINKLREVVPTYSSPEDYNSEERIKKAAKRVRGYKNGKNNSKERSIECNATAE